MVLTNENKQSIVENLRKENRHLKRELLKSQAETREAQALLELKKKLEIWRNSDVVK